MKQNIENGYFKINKGTGKDKILHFSMNCWLELQNDTKKTLEQWFTAFEKEKDVFSRSVLLADVIYASAKAYDLEEGNNIDYNLYKVRDWLSYFDGKDSEDFLKAMTWSITANLGNAGK